MRNGGDRMKEYQVFEKYKLIIVNEIVRELGIENEEYIRNVFNDFKIVLETPPMEEYRYCKDNLFDMSKYYYEYIKLEYLKKKIYNKVIKELLDNWIEIFIDLNKNNNYDKIEKLFYGNKQIIDYFSSLNELKLKDSRITSGIKDLIIMSREWFMSIINKLGYKIKTLDSKMVDIFIMYRDIYFDRIIIKNLLEEDNNYIKRIAKIINDDNEDVIADLIKKWQSTCFKYVKKNGELYRFIYLPINRLKFFGSKTIDVILVHEMIHYIQEMCDKEFILNEVLVQYKASKIVERLHNRGIFIFDNEDDFKIYGECPYEELYPFVNKIIELIPENVLNMAVITEDYQSLEVICGKKINDYIIILNNLYSDFMNCQKFSKENIELCDEYCSEITNYYNNNEIKSRRKVIDKK